MNAEYFSRLRPFNCCMNVIAGIPVVGFGERTNRHGRSIIYRCKLPPHEAEHFDLELIGEHVAVAIPLDGRFSVQAGTLKKLCRDADALYQGLVGLIVPGESSLRNEHIRSAVGHSEAARVEILHALREAGYTGTASELLAKGGEL